VGSFAWPSASFMPAVLRSIPARFCSNRPLSISPQGPLGGCFVCLTSNMYYESGEGDKNFTPGKGQVANLVSWGIYSREHNFSDAFPMEILRNSRAGEQSVQTALVRDPGNLKQISRFRPPQAFLGF